MNTIFDFDDTLFLTMKPTKKNIKFVKTKFGLTRLDKWWDDPRSLLNARLNLNVKKIYDDCAGEKYLCSGRIEKLKLDIDRLLVENGVQMTSVTLRQEGDITLNHKINFVKSILEKKPNEDLMLVDDDEEVINEVNRLFPQVKTIHIK